MSFIPTMVDERTAAEDASSDNQKRCGAAQRRLLHTPSFTTLVILRFLWTESFARALAQITYQTHLLADKR
jgi:hypothetical protein